MGVAYPSDLTTLQQVEEFLGLAAGNSDEGRLYTLIHALTAYLQSVCSRDFALQYISELRNGTGQEELMVLNPPIVERLPGDILAGGFYVFEVDFLGTAMTLSPGDSFPGVVAEPEKIALRGIASVVGVSSSAPNFSQGRFPLGHRNIRINYLSGWSLPNQGTPDWTANATVYGRGTILPTSNNAGGFVFEYQARGGASAVTGGSRPTFPQTPGATVVDGKVTWTNLGITSLLNPLPLDFESACIEIVATRYRQAPRWADTGTGVGPERVNYFIKDMNDSTAALVESMKNLNPVLT